MHQTINKLTALIAFCIILSAPLTHIQAQILDKQYTWNYKLNDNSTIIIENRYSDFEVVLTKNKTTKLTLHIMAKAKEQSELDVFDEALSNHQFNISNNRLFLQIPMWKNTFMYRFLFFGGQCYKEFQNGEEVDVKIISYKVTLYIPADAKLTINSQNSTIRLPNLQNLELESYSDNIFGKNVSLKGKINAKYSKIEFDTLADNQIKINDTQLRCIKTGNLEISSRNSHIKINDTKNINLTSSYDDIRISKMNNIIINAKYGTIEGKSVGDIEIGNSYNFHCIFSKANSIQVENINYSEINIELTKNVNISKSNQSNFKFNVSDNLILRQSYNDKLYINKTGNVNLGVFKYSSIESTKVKALTIDMSQNGVYYIDNTSDIKINSSYQDQFNHKKTLDVTIGKSTYTDFKSQNTEHLRINNSNNSIIACDTIKSVDIIKSNQGNIDIRKLDQSFSCSGLYDKVAINSISKTLKHINFENKCGHFEINVNKSVLVKLETDIEYGSLNINQGAWNTYTDIRKNNSIKYIGYLGARSEKNPLIFIKGYNIKANIISN